MRYFLCFFFSLLIPLIALGDSTTTLELKKEFIAKGNNLIFSDLVTVQGDIPPEVLGAEVGSSPLLGEARIISRTNLQAMIEQYPHTSTFEWIGADECEVRRPAKTLSESDVKKEIELALAKLTNGAGRVDVQEIETSEPVIVPIGKYEIEVELTSNTTATPWSTGSIHVRAQGETVMSSSIRFHWGWWKQGWQANESIETGTLLEPTAFHQADVNVVEMPNAYLEAQLPEESTACRFVGAGHFLNQQDFRPKIIVKRGEPILAHYEKSGVSVDVQVIAMEDGARGSVISVMNSTSRKRFQAKIIDDQNVAYAN